MMPGSLARHASTTLLRLLVMLFSLAVPAWAQVPPTTAPAAGISPIGTQDFVYNKYWTTSYGPAYADIVLSNTNMMSCKPPTNTSLSYALCYYSGPSVPTGKSGNPSLPCTVAADGKSATCICYKLTNADYPTQTYQIDINAILNLGNYLQTREVCNPDGSNCSATSPNPAPACTAANNGTMMPVGTLISVFSSVKNSQYSDPSSPGGAAPGSTNCEAGPYAACMTAPCVDAGKKTADGQALVECRCPIYTGYYEIGQAHMSCNANAVRQPPGGITNGPPSLHIWSAAHNPGLNPPPSAASATKTP